MQMNLDLAVPVLLSACFSLTEAKNNIFRESDSRFFVCQRYDSFMAIVRWQERLPVSHTLCEVVFCARIRMVTRCIKALFWMCAESARAYSNWRDTCFGSGRRWGGGTALQARFYSTFQFIKVDLVRCLYCMKAQVLAPGGTDWQGPSCLLLQPQWEAPTGPPIPRSGETNALQGCC